MGSTQDQSDALEKSLAVKFFKHSLAVFTGRAWAAHRSQLLDAIATDQLLYCSEPHPPQSQVRSDDRHVAQKESQLVAGRLPAAHRATYFQHRARKRTGRTSSSSVEGVLKLDPSNCLPVVGQLPNGNISTT